MTPLTRELVDRLLLHIRCNEDNKDAYDAVLAHDAALRQQLAVMTQDRDTLAKDFQQVYDSYSDAVTLLHAEQKVSDELRVALADAQATVARLEGELKQACTLLYRLIHADERGQGLPFQEAMDDAQRFCQAQQALAHGAGEEEGG